MKFYPSLRASATLRAAECRESGIDPGIFGRKTDALQPGKQRGFVHDPVCDGRGIPGIAAEPTAGATSAGSFGTLVVMRMIGWLLTLGIAVAGCGAPKADSSSIVSNGPSNPAKTPNPTATAPKEPAANHPPTDTSAKPTAVEPNIKKPPGEHTTKSISPVQPPHSEGWQPSKLSPMDVARKIDGAMRGLAGVHATIQVHSVLPIGEGINAPEGKFGGPSEFMVSFPVIEGDPPHPAIHRVFADKGMIRLFRPTGKGETAYTKAKPYRPGGQLDGAKVLKGWYEDMPSLAFSHFTDGRDAFVPLVSQLLKPGSGYTVTSETRTTPYQGRAITTLRILATRKPEISKVEGVAQIEIIVDGSEFVPVTMRTRLAPKDKAATQVDWRAVWYPAKFTEKDFVGH